MDFIGFEVLSFLKFFNGTLTDIHENNFYMERERRTLKKVQFSLDDVHRVILPSAYAKRFRQDVPDHNGQVTFAD